MLNQHAKTFFNKLFTPLAQWLLHRGVSPNMVSVVGTLAVMVAALICYPLGQLLLGTLIITAFIFTDVLDGLMARLAGRQSRFGAFLDSTLDRVQDASIFTALIFYYTGSGKNLVLSVLLACCLVTGFLVSYVRAKAESLGLRADFGLAERPERMVMVLVGAGITGMGVPAIVFTIMMGLLAVASVITIVQRVGGVYRQCQQNTAEQISPH